MEPLHCDEQTGGITIKITKTTGGLYSGEPQQVFAYNLDGAQVWYNLSTVFGELFLGHHIEFTSTSDLSIVWPNGSRSGGSQVKVAGIDENIWFTMYGVPRH